MVKNVLPGNGIFPESIVKAHGRECSDTATEATIPANFPCYKKGTEIRFTITEMN